MRKLLCALKAGEMFFCTLTAIALFLVIATPLVLVFHVARVEAVLATDGDHLSRETALSLVAGDPDHRVWFGGIEEYTLDGVTVTKLTYKTRLLETGRVREFLDGLGVQYTLAPE